MLSFGVRVGERGRGRGAGVRGGVRYQLQVLASADELIN